MLCVFVRYIHIFFNIPRIGAGSTPDILSTCLKNERKNIDRKFVWTGNKGDRCEF